MPNLCIVLESLIFFPLFLKVDAYYFFQVKPFYVEDYDKSYKGLEYGFAVQPRVQNL